MFTSFLLASAPLLILSQGASDTAPPPSTTLSDCQVLHNWLDFIPPADCCDHLEQIKDGEVTEIQCDADERVTILALGDFADGLGGPIPKSIGQLKELVCLVVIL
jgi:hypothetical protein